MRWALLAILIVACDPGVRLGSPCEYSSECPAPLVCGLGRCRDECRRSDDCTLGATCVLSGDPPIGSCELPDDPVCPATPCASGLACVRGACLNECASDAACAAGNVCVETELGVRACVDPRTERDAGIDGGAGDAAPDDAGDAGDAGCTGTACDRVISIALASRRACLASESGAVWCWGEDVVGETSGRASGADDCSGVPCRTRPTRIELLDGALAREVVVGDGFACARTSAGRVQCWGGSARWELGRPEPGPAPGYVRDGATGSYLEGVLSIVAGRNHVLATRADDLVGWGSSGSGELQAATDLQHATVVGSGAWSAIDGGEQFTCAIRGGAVSCWGQNENGQLGRGAIGEPPTSATPSAVSVIAGAYDRIATGAEHACALRLSDGRASCWGLDVTSSPRADGWLPVVPDGARFAEILASPSGRLTCAITAASPRELRCFGGAESGVFYPAGAIRTEAVRMFPSELGDVALASVDGATGCAVDANGTVRCWGDDSRGQLGRGTHGSGGGPGVLEIE